MIVGQLLVMFKYYWDDKFFDDVNLVLLLGFGFYKVDSFKVGKWVVYQCCDDYWVKDLLVNWGYYNFGCIIYEYYLDYIVVLEVFKCGDYDWCLENNFKYWVIVYIGQVFCDGDIIIEEVIYQNFVGMQGFIFNIWCLLFQDLVLCEVMVYVFDFEWFNKNLFYGQYKCICSYFQNFELVVIGLFDEKELVLLKLFCEDLLLWVFIEVYQLLVLDGFGCFCDNLCQVQVLFKDVGYQVKNGKLYILDGELVCFEFLFY